jgi:putative oxidoreductase
MTSVQRNSYPMPSHTLATDRAAHVFARIALGAGFLSAVASRFGLWQGKFDVARFSAFVQYTAEVNAFLPRTIIPAVAVIATVAESVLGLALVIGLRPRQCGFASAALLLAFGSAMAISLGIKEPLDYSVFAAAGAALLVAVHAERNRAVRKS